MHFAQTFIKSLIDKMVGKYADPGKRGAKYFSSGIFDKAVNEFSKVINLKPNDANAFNNRGTAYFYLGNYQQAINDFTNAISIDPKYAEAYHGRGVAHDKLGNKNQAINDFNTTTELDPKHLRAFYHRGQIYFSSGSFYLAINDCDKVIELDPNLAEAYYGRAFIMATIGNKENAIKDLNQALEINPNYTEAIELRNSILSKSAAAADKARVEIYRSSMGISRQSDGKRKRQGISKEVKNSVWRRDQGCCVECGSNEKLEFDHIIPHSKGGSDTDRNIQLLCEKCNRRKHAKI